eukprot:gene10982-3305_t
MDVVFREGALHNEALVQALAQQVDNTLETFRSKVDKGTLDTTAVQATYVSAGGNEATREFWKRCKHYGKHQCEGQKEFPFVVKSVALHSLPKIKNGNGTQVQFTVLTENVCICHHCPIHHIVCNPVFVDAGSSTTVSFSVVLATLATILLAAF